MLKTKIFTTYTIIVSIATIITSCSREWDNPNDKNGSNYKEKSKIELPQVTTSGVTNVKATSATTGGKITSYGGGNILDKGVCWSTAENPDITGLHITNDTVTDNYTSTLTGLAENTKYYVRAYATNQNGTSYSNETELTTNSKPFANFTADDQTVTINTEIQFTSTSKGADSYLWDFGDNTAKSTEENPKHSYTQTGKYSVSLTVKNAYGETTAAIVNFIEVGYAPNANFTLLYSNVGTNELLNIENNTTNATTYEWDFGNTDKATGATPGYSYTTAGTYTIKLTARNDFGESFTFADITVVNARTLTTKASLAGVGICTGFSIGNKGYLINTDKTLWIYNPTIDTWSIGLSYPGTATSSYSVFIVNNKAYIVGGFTNGTTTTSNQVWEYNPEGNGTWTQKNNFPSNTSLAYTFVINDIAFVGAGLNDNWFSVQAFWEYTSATDSWTQRTHPSLGGWSSSGFAINGKGYVYAHGTKEFWEYNPSNHTWTKNTNFQGQSRSYPTVFTVNGKGYIGFGIEFPAADQGNPKHYTDLWEYNATTKTWTQVLESSIFSSPWYITSFTIGNKAYFMHEGSFYEYTP